MYRSLGTIGAIVAAMSMLTFGMGAPLGANARLNDSTMVGEVTGETAGITENTTHRVERNVSGTAGEFVTGVVYLSVTVAVQSAIVGIWTGYLAPRFALLLAFGSLVGSVGLLVWYFGTGLSSALV